MQNNHKIAIFTICALNFFNAINAKTPKEELQFNFWQNPKQTAKIIVGKLKEHKRILAALGITASAAATTLAILKMPNQQPAANFDLARPTLPKLETVALETTLTSTETLALAATLTSTETLALAATVEEPTIIPKPEIPAPTIIKTPEMPAPVKIEEPVIIDKPEIIKAPEMPTPAIETPTTVADPETPTPKESPMPSPRQTATAPATPRKVTEPSSPSKINNPEMPAPAANIHKSQLLNAEFVTVIIEPKTLSPRSSNDTNESPASLPSTAPATPRKVAEPSGLAKINLNTMPKNIIFELPAQATATFADLAAIKTLPEAAALKPKSLSPRSSADSSDHSKTPRSSTDANESPTSPKQPATRPATPLAAKTSNPAPESTSTHQHQATTQNAAVTTTPAPQTTVIKPVIPRLNLGAVVRFAANADRSGLLTPTGIKTDRFQTSHFKTHRDPFIAGLANHAAFSTDSVDTIKNKLDALQGLLPLTKNLSDVTSLVTAQCKCFESLHPQAQDDALTRCDKLSVLTRFKPKDTGFACQNQRLLKAKNDSIQICVDKLHEPIEINRGLPRVNR